MKAAQAESCSTALSLRGAQAESSQILEAKLSQPRTQHLPSDVAAMSRRSNVLLFEPPVSRDDRPSGEHFNLHIQEASGGRSSLSSVNTSPKKSDSFMDSSDEINSEVAANHLKPASIAFDASVENDLHSMAEFLEDVDLEDSSSDDRNEGQNTNSANRGNAAAAMLVGQQIAALDANRDVRDGDEKDAKGWAMFLEDVNLDDD